MFLSVCLFYSSANFLLFKLLTFETLLFSPLRICSMQLWWYAVHSSLKVLLSAFQSGCSLLSFVYFHPFLLQWAFSVRCFSYCCHTSCQERCSCGGNEIKRLYLARPWSYICCCDDGGGNLLPLSLVPKHVTVYLV